MSILKRIVQIIGDVRALKKIEKSDDVVRVILLKSHRNLRLFVPSPCDK